MAGALNANEIPYGLCGGLAMAAHGFVRATEDIDITIPESYLDTVRSMVADLGFIIPGGFTPLKPGTDQAGNLFRVSKVCGEQPLPLDVMLVTPAYKSVWESRSVMVLDGMEIPVISRDGLITLKELGGRPKDLLDLQFLKEQNDAD